MSTPEDQPNAPETGRRRTIWPNLVWGIPLAALVIVGYLGVRALLNRGEVVTVTFTRAAGAKAGVTKLPPAPAADGSPTADRPRWASICGWCRRQKVV